MKPETLAKRLVTEDVYALRRLSAELAWAYRKQRLGVTVTLSSFAQELVGQDLPPQEDWSFTRRLVVALRVRAKAEEKAAREARSRDRRREYMRGYMQGYRQQRALSVLKGRDV